MWGGSLLAPVLGLSDGILTSLTLAAGLLTSGEQPITFSLTLRVALAALVSGAFVFFVGRYAELRGELVHAEFQLNLTSHGQLAASYLGKAASREALSFALISSVASFCGALVPLLPAAVFPTHRWASIITALVVLALLGIGLSRAVHGGWLRWTVGLVASGCTLSVIGAYLKIVG
jgi:predicted membrane protein (TIGR00267 family)